MNTKCVGHHHHHLCTHVVDSILFSRIQLIVVVVVVAVVAAVTVFHFHCCAADVCMCVCVYIFIFTEIVGLCFDSVCACVRVGQLISLAFPIS